MVTTVPIVEQLPTAPNRGMSSSTYPIIADAWAAKIGPWTTQVNVATVWIGVQLDLALEYKNAAAQSAQTATVQAAIASGAGGAAAAEVAKAKAYADNAKASADSAEAVGPGRNTARLHAVVLSFM